jgi:carbon monoxide dehydrogenase subunit G
MLQASNAEEPAIASIRKETVVNLSAEKAWEAIRDVGQVHKKLAPGFVRECRLEGDSRLITFGNGMVARELIVDVDDGARRLCYSARSERLAHHNASFQVIPEGEGRCRVIWIADVLPNAAAATVRAMMEESSGIMKRTLEGGRHDP